ncbi:MAG: DegV family protein [Clostridium sp.]|nr:DegV family protein [Clostridium sp.]
MRKYVISCCTPVDLNRETLERHNIRYVYFHFSLGNDFYDDDFGETVPPAEMYRRMLAGEESKTSQVSVGEYTEFFRTFLEEGKDIIHISLSSGISGTYNSAVIAAEDLRAKYPERKIYVIDSLQASAGYGMFVLKAAELRDAGLDAEEVAGWLEKHKPEEESWFFSTDLTFFIRGGRISRTAGMIGSVLGICPFMRVNKEGKLEVVEKVRTKKRVYRRVADQMEKLAAGGREYSGPVFISNSECPEDAKAVASIIEERFPGTKGKIHISSIGSTIGAHTGPGTVATFFWGTPGRT